jgi:hypothetical protein
MAHFKPEGTTGDLLAERVTWPVARKDNLSCRLKRQPVLSVEKTIWPVARKDNLSCRLKRLPSPGSLVKKEQGACHAASPLLLNTIGRNPDADSGMHYFKRHPWALNLQDRTAHDCMTNQFMTPLTA